MAAENKRLQAARQRTASLTSPDVCLSRQELAELVNAWVWDHHEKMLEHSANWVGQLERGKIRWPGKVSREALRAILGVSTDAALGFVNDRSARAAVKLDNVDRQQFISTGLRLGVGALVLEEPVTALLEISEPTPIPTRVGATEIEQVRTTTTWFTTWDFAYGSGLVRDAVMGQLRWSGGLLKATCPARLRADLFSAVGTLANEAGWMSFEVGAHEDARRVFHFALTCAEKAGDWELRAYVLDCMGLLEIRAGRPDEALTLVDQGLVRADRLPATELSMLHTTRARALATMRRVNETLTAIGTAEDHFARSTPVNDPPLLVHWNAAFLAGNTGQALFDLAIFNHNPTPATDRLTTAATEHTTSHARSRTICLTKLATLTMATGDPVHAATLGHQALDAAGTIHSHRVTNDLRELARYTTKHQHLDQVAHLRHRITTLVCTDRP